MATQKKRMRIVIEIDMDNTAAMFNRLSFNERAMKWIAATIPDYFPQGAVYVATDECEKGE